MRHDGPNDDRTGAAARWLELRRRPDERSRSRALERALVDALGAAAADAGTMCQPLRIVDLGSGAGANVRHLAPLLTDELPHRPQHWTLLDHDDALLASAECPRDRIAATGGSVTSRAVDLAEALSDAVESALLGPCPVSSGRASTPSEPLRSSSPHLVTASAFLDLAGEHFLDELLRCTTDAVVLIALTLDGRIQWTPALPEDDAMHAAFARAPATDTLGGPALGGRAAPVLAERALAAGRCAQLAPSDWVLGAEDDALQRTYARAYARAAKQRGADPAVVEQWLRARLGLIGRGQNELRIGHQDLLITSRSFSAPHGDARL